MAEQTIATATDAEIDECVALISLAFVADPAARWLYPDSRAYLANFPRFLKAFGGRAFTHGSAHLVKGSAAAFWLPPGVEPDEEALISLLQSTVPESGQETVFVVFEEMGRFHPEVPHWYLPLIGPTPRCKAEATSRRCSATRSPAAMPTGCQPISRRRERGTCRSIAGTVSRPSARSSWERRRQSHRCCGSRASAALLKRRGRAACG